MVLTKRWWLWFYQGFRINEFVQSEEEEEKIKTWPTEEKFALFLWIQEFFIRNTRQSSARALVETQSSRASTTASMLNNKPVPPPKPPIAAKPKIAQKTNYIIVGADSQPRNGRKTEQCMENQPLLPPPPRSTRDVNHHLILPSSPPNYADCANDCCGILHNMQLECIQRQKNNKNGNGSSFQHHRDEREIENHKSTIDKHFTSSSQSFDSSSSSSGGFRDVDYVTKTRVAYESYDNHVNDHETPTYQMPIGHSKVQEMKSKLLAQQQQQLRNNEPTVPINRQQVQKSSQQLEKVLGMRMEKEIRHKAPTTNNNNHDKLVKRLSKSFDDASDHNVASIANQIGANISKQIHQKLTEEMKQQCEMIKEKFLIEKVAVQQHYGDYVVWCEAIDDGCWFYGFHPFFIPLRLARISYFQFYYYRLHCWTLDSRLSSIDSIFSFFSHPITE